MSSAHYDNADYCYLCKPIPSADTNLRRGSVVLSCIAKGGDKALSLGDYLAVRAP